MVCSHARQKIVLRQGGPRECVLKQKRKPALASSTLVSRLDHYQNLLLFVLSLKPNNNIRGIAKNKPLRHNEDTTMIAATDELSYPFASANAILPWTYNITAKVPR